MEDFAPSNVEQGGNRRGLSEDSVSVSEPSLLQSRAAIQPGSERGVYPDIPKGKGAGGLILLKPLRILEALSATGLRAVRYAKEIEGVREVVANDLDANAVTTIAENVAHNGLSSELVKAKQGDAK